MSIHRMGRQDNYPDDIRMYDNDPRSPFFEEPQGDEEDDGGYGDYCYEQQKDKDLYQQLADLDYQAEQDKKT